MITVVYLLACVYCYYKIRGVLSCLVVFQVCKRVLAVLV